MFAIDVMIMRPLDVKTYQFVGGAVQYPELLARHQSNTALVSTNLIPVEAANPSAQYYLDWVTLQTLGPVPRSDPNYWHFDEEVVFFDKTDTCSANVNYEPPDEDWFG